MESRRASVSRRIEGILLPQKLKCQFFSGLFFFQEFFFLQRCFSFQLHFAQFIIGTPYVLDKNMVFLLKTGGKIYSMT